MRLHKIHKIVLIKHPLRWVCSSLRLLRSRISSICLVGSPKGEHVIHCFWLDCRSSAANLFVQDVNFEMWNYISLFLDSLSFSLTTAARLASECMAGKGALLLAWMKRMCEFAVMRIWRCKRETVCKDEDEYWEIWFFVHYRCLPHITHDVLTAMFLRSSWRLLKSGLSSRPWSSDLAYFLIRSDSGCYPLTTISLAYSQRENDSLDMLKHIMFFLGCSSFEALFAVSVWSRFPALSFGKQTWQKKRLLLNRIKFFYCWWMWVYGGLQYGALRLHCSKMIVRRSRKISIFERSDRGIVAGLDVWCDEYYSLSSAFVSIRAVLSPEKCDTQTLSRSRSHLDGFWRWSRTSAASVFAVWMTFKGQPYVRTNVFSYIQN